MASAALIAGPGPTFGEDEDTFGDATSVPSTPSTPSTSSELPVSSPVPSTPDTTSSVGVTPPADTSSDIPSSQGALPEGHGPAVPSEQGGQTAEGAVDTGGDDYEISMYTKTAAIEYKEVAAEYKEPSSYNVPRDTQILLGADKAVTEGVAKIENTFKGYEKSAVFSDKATGDLTWEFEIPKDGLYEIKINYIPDENDKAEIQRQILIDGESPFQESENIGFNRRWREMNDPKVDINGDQLTPKLEQVTQWDICEVSDIDGMMPDSLRYLLTQGKHTLTISYVNAAMYIGEVEVVPATDFPKYEQVKAEYDAKGYKEYTGAQIKVQAEEADFRSSQVLRRQYNADPAAQPYEMGHVVLNTIGGFNWRKGNQRVEYKIDVPEDGLYKLNMRIFQRHGEGLSVHRQITIDGQVPFEEVSAYPFAFNAKWQSNTISDDEGNPYLFYLTKGEHTLGLLVKMGQASAVIEELFSINSDVTNLIRSIKKIIGDDPDLNFDYDLEKNYPQLITEMQSLRDRYHAQIEYIKDYCDRTPTLANSLYTAADQLDYLSRKPDQIPSKLKQMNDVQGSVSQWYYDIQDQPMEIDFIQFNAPDEEPEFRLSNFWEKLGGTLVNFAASFYKDYDSIMYAVDDETANVKSDVVLDVWVARSKEMAEVLQRMSNEEFTQDKGIGVKINILPSGSVGAVGSISPLMLAVISGEVPDIALGSDSQTPVELAIRGAAYDLSTFSDFAEVSKRFLPGTMTPLEYKGGIYALPENMDFKMMFYRKDILKDIEVQIPQTWDDLYNRTLPILDQNGMEFFMASDFGTFLFQNGGEFYNEDGTQTMLGSNVAYQSFLQWCNNYTVYDIPKTAEIYNHFRMGDIPLVIGGFGDYMKIMYAAPDLYGKWDIAPIPGIRQPDGTINRSSGGASTTLMIFTDSKEKEGAWEFAKWWLDAEVQYMYSVEIEAIMGLEARWNTANVEAFLNLSWDENHLKVFNVAWRNFKNMENTLGGYYTGRNVTNAWTRVVMNDQTPRTSWEKAVDDITNEMLRKQIEYGIAEEK